MCIRDRYYCDGLVPTHFSRSYYYLHTENNSNRVVFETSRKPKRSYCDRLPLVNCFCLVSYACPNHKLLKSVLVEQATRVQYMSKPWPLALKNKFRCGSHQDLALGVFYFLCNVIKNYFSFSQLFFYNTERHKRVSHGSKSNIWEAKFHLAKHELF